MRAILWPLVAVLLVSCGDKKGEKPAEGPAQGAPDTVAYGLTKEQAVQFAQTGEQECLDLRSCSPSVAFITFIDHQGKDKYNVGVCSGTLVGADLLLTNSHCIPPALKASGPNADCRGHMWFNFVRDQRNPQFETQLGCAKVLYASEITVGGADDADYALVQLDARSRRPVVRTNRLGLEDNFEFTVHKVNPPGEFDGMTGRQETIRCRNVQASMMQQDNYDKFGRTTMFSGCTIIGGNSGSAILDSSGEIRGVIQSHVIDANGLAKQLQYMGFYLSEGLTEEINMGTNFSCIDLPRVNDHLPKNPACLERTSVNKLSETRLEESARAHLPMLPSDAARKFAWRLKAFDKEEGGRNAVYVRPVPVCVAQNVREEDSLRVSLSWARYLLGVDRYVRLVFELMHVRADDETTITVKPTSEGKALVTLSAFEEHFREELPYCEAGSSE